MRILVTGGRDYKDRAVVFRELDAICDRTRYGTMVVIQGGARGADALAREWCFRQSDNIAGLINAPADWRGLGLAAGIVRNQAMIDDHKPDAVLAFPGGRGTADMVRRARAANVPVIEVPAHD